MTDGKEREDDIASHSVSTRSHGSERGRARERAWELVDFWSTTYLTLLIYGTYQPPLSIQQELVLVT